MQERRHCALVYGSERIRICMQRYIERIVILAPHVTVRHSHDCWLLKCICQSFGVKLDLQIGLDFHDLRFKINAHANAKALIRRLSVRGLHRSTLKEQVLL